MIERANRLSNCSTRHRRGKEILGIATQYYIYYNIYYRQRTGRAVLWGPNLKGNKNHAYFFLLLLIASCLVLLLVNSSQIIKDVYNTHCSCLLLQYIVTVLDHNKINI